VSEESTRQLAAVVRMLGVELGYRVNTYTAENILGRTENCGVNLKPVSCAGFGGNSVFG